PQHIPSPIPYTTLFRSKVTYSYDDGSTFATDTVSQADGSYQQGWTKNDGSHGTNNYVAATGEVSGSSATVGVGYSYAWDNTKLADRKSTRLNSSHVAIS